MYCQKAEISSFGKCYQISVEQLIDVMKELETLGAHNINLVTPSHYSQQIIEALKLYKPSIPIVWNSNGYESIETIKQLKNLVDIYLVDMKYMDNELAFNLSKAKDYPEICQQAIIQMRKNQPSDIIENGLMKKGLIVRHLVLPNEVENSFSVLDWISANLGTKTYVSIMSQYTPYHLATSMPKYNRKIKPIEYKRVINHLNNLKFSNGFIQELSSSNTCYIPDFNT